MAIKNPMQYKYVSVLFIPNSIAAKKPKDLDTGYKLRLLTLI